VCIAYVGMSGYVSVYGYRYVGVGEYVGWVQVCVCRCRCIQV
jgi:hypothetical protein